MVVRGISSKRIPVTVTAAAVAIIPTGSRRPPISASYSFSTQANTSTRLQQQVTETETAERTSSAPTTSTPAVASPVTLKSLVRPFLMKFHPDRQASHNNISVSGRDGDSNTNTTLARNVNLKAIQTLNGMIDTMDQIYERASPSSSSSSSSGKGMRIDLQTTYTIEFLVTSNRAFSSSKKKKAQAPLASRRSMDISFTHRDVQSVNSVDANGRYSIAAATALRYKSMKGIVNLMRVAGLQVANDVYDQIDEANGSNGNGNGNGAFSTMMDHELDFSSGPQGRGEGRGNMGYKNGRSFGDRPPRNAYEESRQKYINSVDWKKFNKMYDKALEDMERDIATEGLIAMSPERRMNLVSSVISRIRVENHGHDENENENENENEDVDDTTRTRNDHESGGIDAVSQLIAIRRLSLLFSDNFDYLEMEEMGRLWETMVIVLTPERRSRRNHGDDPVVGTPFSRLKRLKRGRESGFKFAFHSVETDEVGANGDEDGDDNDNNNNNNNNDTDGEDQMDRVTVYIPVDFLDDDLISEMKWHLDDFHALCLSRGELEGMFPPDEKKFQDDPRFEDDYAPRRRWRQPRKPIK